MIVFLFGNFLLEVFKMIYFLFKIEKLKVVIDFY